MFQCCTRVVRRGRAVCRGWAMMRKGHDVHARDTAGVHNWWSAPVTSETRIASARRVPWAAIIDIENGRSRNLFEMLRIHE
jgi:hypothetical protein